MTIPDVVIRGGYIVDGTGAAAFKGDVAITDGTITAVGRVDQLGRSELLADGLIVCPGFIDIHTHYDGQAVWDKHLAPSSRQGVTTAVMGNCGVGFAPVRPTDRERLIELMEGVEDIPGAVMSEGLDWHWETFPEYLDVLASRPRDIDLCAQLAHGPLRVYVMGERGAKMAAPNPQEIAEMRRLTAEAIQAGAFGFTTTRSQFHRTADGSFTPCMRGTEEELTAIAMGLRDAGFGVMELISDFDPSERADDFELMYRITKATGRPFSFSLTQRHYDPTRWKIMLNKIDAAQRDGIDIRGQVAPRSVGVLFGLQTSLNPFCETPAYSRIAHLSVADRIRAMRDPGFRAEALSQLPPSDVKNHMGIFLTRFDRMYPLGNPVNYEPPSSSSLAALAHVAGKDAAEVAYDMLLEDDGKNFIFAPLTNYAEENLDAVREMLVHPHTLPGLGDGGAHVRLIADASFSTFLLTYWARDRIDGRIPIEAVIKKQTLDCAQALGMNDRGVLAVGKKADVNVIDLNRLDVGQPYMAADLPAGGQRLLQDAKGYVATIVSGRFIVRDGKATDELPGKLVRGAGWTGWRR